MVGPVCNRLGRGRDTLLIVAGGRGWPYARCDDQAPFGGGKRTDHRGLPRRGDDAVRPGLERAGGALHNDFRDIPLADQARIKIRPVERGKDGDRQNAGDVAPAPLHCRAHDMRIAMNGEEIEIILR